MRWVLVLDAPAPEKASDTSLFAKVDYVGELVRSLVDESEVCLVETSFAHGGLSLEFDGPRRSFEQFKGLCQRTLRALAELPIMNVFEQKISRSGPGRGGSIRWAPGAYPDGFGFTRRSVDVFDPELRPANDAQPPRTVGKNRARRG